VAGNFLRAVAAQGRVGLPPLLRKHRQPGWMPGALPDSWFERRRERAFEVGLLVPTSGSAGIWGPSTIACAQLAAEEINRSGGLLGQEVRLRIVDAADEVSELAERTDQMLDDAQIDAIVGMHISSVRQKLLGAVRGRVPYVYTPLYEGGERTAGVYAIGETPQQQLRPALHTLTERFALKRLGVAGKRLCLAAYLACFGAHLHRPGRWCGARRSLSAVRHERFRGGAASARSARYRRAAAVFGG
jgi:ABC-type branched-subunit amino acid transport system substrate-binding protein